MRLKRFLKPLVSRIQAGAGADSVYGDRIEAHGHTIIPVAKVSYGFGGGWGRKGLFRKAQKGFGGGGGLNLTPVGVIDVGQKTKFVPVAQGRKMLFAAVIGFLAGFAVLKRITA